MQTKAIIIGGGIGGLTAAIALQRVGIDVTVLERAEELREVRGDVLIGADSLHSLTRAQLFSAKKAEIRLVRMLARRCGLRYHRAGDLGMGQGLPIRHDPHDQWADILVRSTLRPRGRSG